jgi:hypothetical protein
MAFDYPTPEYAGKRHKREGAVTCKNCSYFKEQNKDRSGLCLIVDHKKLPAWIERSTCIVQHTEGCDLGLAKPPEFVL